MTDNTDKNEQPDEAPAKAGVLPQDMEVTVEQQVPNAMEFVGSVDDLHLEGHFNTFRMGDKWADLQPMTELELSVMSVDAMITVSADAMVVGVYVGQLDDMLELHTGANHGCTQPEPADRKIELRRILEAAYGTRFDGSERCVVIYMYVRPEGETTADED